jgi:hypothetical protein
MVFSLFKNDDQMYNEAVDLVKRKEYDKAIQAYQKCIEKDKDGNHKAMSTIAISVLNLHNRTGDAGAYMATSNVMKSNPGMDFELGLSTFNTDALSKECELMAESINTRSMGGSDINACKAKGDALMACAQKFQQYIGDNVLVLNEFYNNVSITGTKLALTLMAESNESYSNGYAWSDPKKAAEFEQIAYNYRKQLGESGDDNQQRIRSYSKSCICWICGRETTGEGMHFLPMSSDISPQERKNDSTMLPSADDAYQSIYVCRACYTAISRRADAISQHYHQLSMQELAKTEARLQAEIASLQAEVSSLRTSVAFSQR